MSFTDKQIVEAYSRLFEGLSFENKIDLIENLSKSLKNGNKDKDKIFFRSFGAFASNKSPKEIIKDIRSGRKFKRNEISF